MSSPLTPAPLRLRVNGSSLVDPSGTNIRLTGFNWQIGRTGPTPGADMQQWAPHANMARLVGVLWGNTRPLQQHPNKECMTYTAPNYFNDKCFEDLDPWVKSATDAGLWVILAVRGEFIAGQDYATDPGSVVFRNATLQKMMFAMWRHVAGHYRTFDRIAAYELLSEPRDKEVSADKVRDVYEGACASAQQADPNTPCLVGGTPYYKLWTFGDNTILRNNTDVIYTFDYFNPDAYVFARDGTTSAFRADGGPLRRSSSLSARISTYGQRYSCQSLYAGWEEQVCPTWNVSSPESLISFDRAWHEHNLRTFALPLRDRFRVPLLINQFEVVHGVTETNGRYSYIEDLLSLAQDLEIGWAWWTWEGGNSGGWSQGSSEIVFRWPNNSIMVDELALKSMAPYFL
jgi:hypothetical protein